MTLKDEIPRSVGAQYATGQEWWNRSRKNEEAEPKKKKCPVVDVTGNGSKVRCCKEQYFIGTWNVRSVNQGKLDVVKQEITRLNEHWHLRNQWTKKDENLIQMTLIYKGGFNSDDSYIYYYGEELLRRNGGALIVNRSVWNAISGCNLRNDRMISVQFQASHSPPQ